MNQSERREAIRSRLDALGAFFYPELAKWLGVSEMTIRRDVEELSQLGTLRSQKPRQFRFRIGGICCRERLQAEVKWEMPVN